VQAPPRAISGLAVGVEPLDAELVTLTLVAGATWAPVDEAVPLVLGVKCVPVDETIPWTELVAATAVELTYGGVGTI
jgi:hypothetical protein